MQQRGAEGVMKGTMCRKEVQWYDKGQYVQERGAAVMTRATMSRRRVQG